MEVESPYSAEVTAPAEHYFGSLSYFSPTHHTVRSYHRDDSISLSKGQSPLSESHLLSKNERRELRERPLRLSAVGVDGWPCVYIREPGLIQVPAGNDLAYADAQHRQADHIGV